MNFNRQYCLLGKHAVQTFTYDVCSTEIGQGHRRFLELAFCYVFSYLGKEISLGDFHVAVLGGFFNTRTIFIILGSRFVLSLWFLTTASYHTVIQN